MSSTIINAIPTKSKTQIKKCELYIFIIYMPFSSSRNGFMGLTELNKCYFVLCPLVMISLTVFVGIRYSRPLFNSASKYAE